MGLHHRIKPHHHFAIWTISAVLFLVTSAFYNTVSVDRLSAQSEPSEQTKRFFGFDDNEGEGRDFVTPEACQSAQSGEMQKLSQDMQTTSNELSALYQKDTSQMTQEEQQAHQAQIKSLQDKLTSLQAQMDELTKTLELGPSDECKIAIVRQAASMMEEMNSKMDSKFFGTLTRVDTVIAKVEAAIPDLSAAGVDQEKIDRIKADVTTIKTSTATLRSFFSKIQASMQTWLDLTKSDPLKAFDQMQAGGAFINEGEAGSAAKAADTMVSAFEDLVAILDGIAEGEQNGTE